MLGNDRERQRDDREVSPAHATENQEIADRQGEEPGERDAAGKTNGAGIDRIKPKPYGDHRHAISAKAEEGGMAEAQRPRLAPQEIEAQSEQPEQHDIAQGRDIVVVSP